MPGSTSVTSGCSVPRENKINIHQFHCGSAVADAITNSMLFIQSMLQGFGLPSDIFVEHIDQALDKQIRGLDDLHPAASDILLIHHSMGHDAFARLAALRCRKFLVYHNITPPELLEGDPNTQAYAIKGYSQLSLFRDTIEAAIAVSPFNAGQLSRRGFADVTVIPLLKDFAAIRSSPHAARPYHDEDAVFRLLFVGRIAPHKCQHALVDFVDQIRSIDGVPLELVLVGHFDNAGAYKSQLDGLIDRRKLGGSLAITGRVPAPELFPWYRSANAYVSLIHHGRFS